MKVIQALMVVAAAVAFFGSAMAVPPGNKVEFAGGPMGKVVFDGKTHADKGAKCNDCHTKIFQMKKGSTKITMAAMNKGETCGTCHNGTKAFTSNDPKNCKNCHKK
jgi:c(7)-type cytochrome triheme protein